MRDTLSRNQSITIWLKKACGSEGSVQAYMSRIRRFFEHVGIEPDELLRAWKQVKYNLRLREQFVDEWTEKIEAYIYGNFEDHAPISRMQELTVIVSFFKHSKIPVEPEREKHTYVRYHNRDITKEEIKRILQYASPRDRTFFLMMLESGLRPMTLVQLRYKHIRKDFEANRVPMTIELPSELLKDRVEARWSFIGEDGFEALKTYLKPRLPLKNEDLIFESKRSDIKHQFLTRNTFSKIFSKITLKLGIAETERKGKPKKVRLYCLRKFFNNECRYEGFNPAYREFWLGHNTTQVHYISRDPEVQRQEYGKCYQSLRIYKPKRETQKMIEEQAARIAQLETELKEHREKKDKEIERLNEKIAELNERFAPLEALDKLMRDSRNKGKALRTGF